MGKTTSLSGGGEEYELDEVHRTLQQHELLVQVDPIPINHSLETLQKKIEQDPHSCLGWEAVSAQKFHYSAYQKPATRTG